MDRIVECKELLPTVRHSGGEAVLQKGYEWTGDGQLFFSPTERSVGVVPTQLNEVAPSIGVEPTRREGSEELRVERTGADVGKPSIKPFLVFEFKVEEKEYRRLVLRLTHSYDYGTYRVLLDGQPAAGPLDLYAKTIKVHDHSLGDHELELGVHAIRLECTGKNAQSTGERVGVDSVRLRQRWLVKRPVVKP